MSNETNKKIQELQIIDQNLQNLFLQKQAFEMESTETQHALKELQSSGDEVYKIIGGLMLKSDREKVKDELKNKEKIIDLRLKAIEKQEKNMSEKAENLKDEISKEINKKNRNI